MENVTELIWQARKALLLLAAGYQALLVPSLGANVISLKAALDGRELDILRTPPNAETLLSDPYAYGIPVLFPANRVAGGYYECDGVRYEFPQNYPNGVHIHGVLHNREWPVTGYGAQAGRAWVRLTLSTQTDDALRSHFPIPMVIHLDISVSDEGLAHRFTVENHSADKRLPVGLAYHTAFRVAFDGDCDSVRLHVPITGRCTDDPTDRLPNGKTIALNDFESRIATPQGAWPMEEAVDYLYAAQPNASDMVMTDTRSGARVVYRADRCNHYWILWNKTATEGFIAVEPQTWLSNAMHFPHPQEQDAIFIQPGETWRSECRIFAQP